MRFGHSIMALVADRGFRRNLGTGKSLPFVSRHDNPHRTTKNMKIDPVQIQNFRGFKNETIYFPGYVCLVGPNGAGKSTVLAALNIVFRQ